MDKKGSNDFLLTILSIFFGIIGIVGVLKILENGIKTIEEIIFFAIFAFLVGLSMAFLRKILE